MTIVVHPSGSFWCFKARGACHLGVHSGYGEDHKVWMLAGRPACTCVWSSMWWEHRGLATGWTRCLSPARGGIHTAYTSALPMHVPSSRSAKDRKRPLVPSMLMCYWLHQPVYVCLWCVCWEYVLSLTTGWVSGHGAAAASPLGYWIRKPVRFLTGDLGKIVCKQKIC